MHLNVVSDTGKVLASVNGISLLDLESEGGMRTLSRKIAAMIRHAQRENIPPESKPYPIDIETRLRGVSFGDLIHVVKIYRGETSLLIRNEVKPRMGKFRRLLGDRVVVELPDQGKQQFSIHTGQCFNPVHRDLYLLPIN